MEKQFLVIEEVKKSKFESALNDYVSKGWLPHWETFKIYENSGYIYFYIILESKCELLM